MTDEHAELLTFFAKQTGDTCWRLTSTQYFHSKEAALAAMDAAVALASQNQEDSGVGLRPAGRWEVDRKVSTS